MLHRQGNKSKLAHKIIPLFPEHDCYIEPFFGSGSIFFAKPQVKYNLLNDIDEDVFNLHRQLQLNPQALKVAFEKAIVHQKILDSFKTNPPTDPLQRAVEYLVCINFSFFSMGNTLNITRQNIKSVCLSKFDNVVSKLQNALFTSKDWRKFFNAIDRKTLKIKSNFCYVDPPYLNSKSYKSNFLEQDVVDLLDTLTNKGLRFAYSEFDNPFIIEQAQRRGLTVHNLGERRNIGNRRTEILLTNY